MDQSFAKYSIVLLLVTFNICFQCATGDQPETNKDQEGTHFHDASANHEDHSQKTNEDHIEHLENKVVCEKKENCEANFHAGWSSEEQKAGSDTPHEQVESKTEEKLDKFDTAPEVLADEKKKDEKGFSEVEQVNEKSTYEQVRNADALERNTVEEKEDNSDAKNINTERENEKETSDNSKELKGLPSIVKSVSESNSTFYHWLKFILDPIIEEFKDGIYPKLSDKTNTTLSNVSIASENNTVSVETANVTVSEPANITVTENVTDSGKKVKFQCTGKNVTDNVNATVKLITTAQLLQMLNFEKNDTENVTDCLLVMFYAPWCHFCAKIGPYYNALARAFPQLDFVAVDTAQFSNLLARFGTVSVPNILVFHQSRAAVKFNQTERTFENLVTFITNSTGLEANKTVNVTEADYLGPVPSVPTNEPDYLLLISWMFVIFCSSCMFVKSNKGQQWINRVRILWQEHQHID